MSDAGLRALLWQMLLWGALPLWVLAGAVDWMCHRRTRLAHTAGWPEAALHVLEFVLVAVPVVLGLFLEIDAALLGVMAACALTHLAVGWIDTAYTRPRRDIGTLEQAVHPFLELTPLFACAVVFVLHAAAWAAPHGEWNARAEPVPPAITGGVLLALGLGFALALVEFAMAWRGSGAWRRSAARNLPRHHPVNGD